MVFRNFIDEFNATSNAGIWDSFYSYIANSLTVRGVPLDNVFFVNTPGFVVMFSERDKAIVHKKASSYSSFIIRKVLVEKCTGKKEFTCFYDRQYFLGDKISTRPYHVLSYRLNWNETAYGNEYDFFKSFSKFIKERSHWAIFLYVDESFFDTLNDTKMIRVAIVKEKHL